MSTFKAFEKVGKRLRSFCSPKARKAYQELCAKGLPKNPKQPFIALDLKATELDADGGRYFYYIVKDILSAGYTPIIKTHYTFLSTFAYKRYKALTLDLPIGFYNGSPPEGTALTLTDHKEEQTMNSIPLIYEERLPRATEVALPYCSHPYIMEKESDLKFIRSDHPRTKTIFFAGGISRPKYANPILRKKYGIMPRADGLDLILKNAHKLDMNQLSLHYQPENRIPQDQWLQTLGNSSFFLAFPGVSMPISHNLVEALSVGTIPILQYAEYLTPPLENDINCLTFSNQTEFIKVIQKASTLSPKEIARLSKSVIEYYERNLKLGNFTQRLLRTSPEGIIVNEFMVAKNL